MLAFLVMDDITMPIVHKVMANKIIRMMIFMQPDPSVKEQAIRMTGYSDEEVQMTRDFIDSLG